MNAIEPVPMPSVLYHKRYFQDTKRKTAILMIRRRGGKRRFKWVADVIEFYGHDLEAAEDRMAQWINEQGANAEECDFDANKESSK